MITRNMFPEYAELKYTFTYDLSCKRWIVSDMLDGANSPIAYVYRNKLINLNEIDLLETTYIGQQDDILENFKVFMKRPEFKIFDYNTCSSDSTIAYQEIFAGAILLRARYHKPGCNPDDAWPQIEKVFKWLNTTDFYSAPGSSIYHDSYAGGLCQHSIRVAQLVFDLMHCDKFQDISKYGDAVFCALVHDWCKIGLYESYMKNVKNENTGRWEKVQSYRHTGDAIMNLGHGVSSMFLASKFFKLNLEEASAIRWHMGAYRTPKEEFSELQTSNENFLLVHLLQFADQLSLVKY